MINHEYEVVGGDLPGWDQPILTAGRSPVGELCFVCCGSYLGHVNAYFAWFVFWVGQAQFGLPG